MPRVAILADTHVPSRADAIPAWVEDEIRAADRVIHAGDFDARAAYDRLESLAADLTAVSGNVDPAGLDLPARATLELEGVTFVVTHGTGSPDGWTERVVDAVREEAGPDGGAPQRDADEGATQRTVVGVGAHTHEVVDDTVDGIRLLNPGSATGAAPAERTTMLVADVADGAVAVEVLEG